jgi:hypothetical protein
VDEVEITEIQIHYKTSEMWRFNNPSS